MEEGQGADHLKEKTKDPETENGHSLEIDVDQDQCPASGPKKGQFPGPKDHPESLVDPGHIQEPRKEVDQDPGRRGVAVPEVK